MTATGLRLLSRNVSLRQSETPTLMATQYILIRSPGNPSGSKKYISQKNDTGLVRTGAPEGTRFQV